MNSETINPGYQPPVAQLLSLDKPLDGEWRDYQALGLSLENVPDLIRLAVDEQLNNSPAESASVWAPVHAWRALGQLGAPEAVGPLLSLLQLIDDREDDWAQSDIPQALAEIGKAALEPAANFLADATHGEWARVAAADALGRMGEAHPDLRGECVAKLAAQLEKFSEQDENLNAFLVTPLWDLRAVEAMPVIERAYAAGCVEEAVTGDVEDVQIHFGLKPKREHEPRPNQLTETYKLIAELDERRRALEQENEELRVELRQITAKVPFGERPAPYIAPPKIGRNDPCPCGSGKKYKKCCGA